MTFCLGCGERARKPCHSCGKLMYCSQKCAYRCADAHLRSCFTSFRTNLNDVLGTTTISLWISRVVDNGAGKASFDGGISKKNVAIKSHIVLRSQTKK